jgi:AbrB family looped-hinge helix DNA binding protein
MKEKQEKQRICTYNQFFYGFITVSDKGQIVLPKRAREELNINIGNRLLVIRRKDKKGITLIKAEIMNGFFKSLQEE